MHQKTSSTAHHSTQVTKSEQFVKIYVSGGQEGSLTYEVCTLATFSLKPHTTPQIHKDCYKQLLESIQDAQGPASFVEDNLNR